jgi:antitoxin component of MazEF toxin-antitoxin module
MTLQLNMKTTIQKWGHSPADRIPQPVIVAAEQEITLEPLVEQITDENRHVEIETGPRVGEEVW